VIEPEEKTPMSRREDLIEAVILVQKHLETPTDIVTFCGRKGVSVAEIEWHLEYYIRRVQKETDAKIGHFRPQAGGSRRLPSRLSSGRLEGSECRTPSPHHHARDRW
jgi:hypothetical protein